MFLTKVIYFQFSLFVPTPHINATHLFTMTINIIQLLTNEALDMM